MTSEKEEKDWTRELNRDSIWCMSLVQVLDTEEVNQVLRFFNELRPDDPDSDAYGEGPTRLPRSRTDPTRRGADFDLRDSASVKTEVEKTFAEREADSLRAMMYEFADAMWPGDRKWADKPPSMDRIRKNVLRRIGEDPAEDEETTAPSEEEDEDVCPICRERPTSRANSLHNFRLLPCPLCTKLIRKGRDRILKAMKTVAEGGAFGRACARSAAADIVREVSNRPREREDE